MKENHPLWLRLLPASLRLRIAHRARVVKALWNTGWLFGDRVLRVGDGLIVLEYSARRVLGEHK